MATGVENIAVSSRPSPAEALERLAQSTRVFVSMPCIRGITPRALLEKGTEEELPVNGGPRRYYGSFRLDEVGVPAFDHGLLYGDAVFEGVLVEAARIFKWREHLERLYESARRVEIEIPYSPEQLTRRIVDAVGTARTEEDGTSYLRLVVTRGIGDLGVSPGSCAGSTVYCAISRIQLYPESTYEEGIRLSLARQVRRAGADVLSPQIKSCNYLNNIAALLETRGQGTQETLMLTGQGFVAEASADNIFIVTRKAGWENDPGKIVVITPSAEYCLKGITRDLVLHNARALGFATSESPAVTPEDLFGADKEVFLTGTAAGVVPVVALDGRMIGDGAPGQITKKLRSLVVQEIASPDHGLSVRASQEQVVRYLAQHAGRHGG